jgi:hypothetical protein
MTSTTDPASLTRRAFATTSNADLAEQLRTVASDYQGRPVLAALLAEAARRLSALATGKP